MTSSKPKHVAMFYYIVYIIKLCQTKITILLIIKDHNSGMCGQYSIISGHDSVKDYFIRNAPPDFITDGESLDRL
jgi:hypothetical protein